MCQTLIHTLGSCAGIQREPERNSLRDQEWDVLDRELPENLFAPEVLDAYLKKKIIRG